MSNDSWRTPDDLFEALDKGGVYQGIQLEGFHFDIDLCATKENSKCNIFYKDYLNDILTKKEYAEWAGEKEVWCEYPARNIPFTVGAHHKITAFMNPPYSNPKPFIEKAWEDSKHCKIVCLVKVDPSTKWWATFWEYNKKYYNANEFTLDCETDPPTIYNGPRPGCKVIFFPKRIKFGPPKEGIKCTGCCTCGKENCPYGGSVDCPKCKGTGNKKLSGPSFASCLLIFDRRGI